jgi:hypothetical protein
MQRASRKRRSLFLLFLVYQVLHKQKRVNSRVQKHSFKCAHTQKGAHTHIHTQEKIMSVRKYVESSLNCKTTSVRPTTTECPECSDGHMALVSCVGGGWKKVCIKQEVINGFTRNLPGCGCVDERRAIAIYVCE